METSFHFRLRLLSHLLQIAVDSNIIYAIDGFSCCERTAAGSTGVIAGIMAARKRRTTKMVDFGGQGRAGAFRKEAAHKREITDRQSEYKIFRSYARDNEISVELITECLCLVHGQKMPNAMAQLGVWLCAERN